MLRSPLLALALLLAGLSAAHADVYPLKFDRFGVGNVLRVHFSRSPILVDETWYVAGSCENAMTYTEITVVSFSIGDDLDIAFTKSRALADRVVCIVNPDDAPDQFWQAYN